MPQIANQDYTVIKPEYATNINDDGLALATLVRQIKRNTILDCVLLRPLENALYLTKVVAIDVKNVEGYFASVFFGVDNTGNNKNNKIFISYSSPETYEVIAKLQKQLNEKNALPVFRPVDDHLGCYKDDGSIKISVNGYFVSAEDEDEVITDLSIDYNSPVGSAESLVLDESDLQYLIGVSYY